MSPDLLALAWPRLDLPALHRLVTVELGWPGWRVVDNRVQGPCPVQRSPKCKGDAVAGYVYARTDGGPPWVRCHHRQTCAFSESLFEVLAEHHGSRAQAAAAVKRLAGLLPGTDGPPEVPRAIWPERRTLVVRRQTRRAAHG